LLRDLISPAPGGGSLGIRAFALALASLGFAALLLAQVDASSFDQSDPFASRFKEKSHFELKIRTPKPGGAVKITANAENCSQNLTVCEATGGVVVEYQDIKILADRLTYDRDKGTAEAEGHVVIDQGPTRIAGSSATFDLKSKTGTVHDAEADLEPSFHVIAKTISKVGETTYEVKDGMFTACRVPDPAWSFRTSSARITLDDYARMHNVTFRAAKVPLLYSPYIVWPTKPDRTSGFLVPGLGYNNRRGAYLGLTYYGVLGRSTDFTTGLDLYSKGAIGLGQELRWAPSAESAGVFQGFVVRDPDAQVCSEGTATSSSDFCTLPSGAPGQYDTQTKTRWKLRLDHSSSDLPGDIRAAVSIRDYSDVGYLQDFERSFALNATRTIQSTAFLTKNFAEDSINLRADRTETFFSNSVLLERVPSLEYTHRTSQIGQTPLYAAMDASFSHLFVNRGPQLPHGEYNRFDLHPQLSVPLKGIPWLSVTAKGGGRLTYYSDSVTPLSTEGQTFTGDGVTRRYVEGGASIIGPSFSRIYDFSLGPFVKWKHIIEPRVEYSYLSDVSDIARVPSFDEIDSIYGQSSVRYSLINRLLAKTGGENAPSAQEIATLELSQIYNIRNPQSLTGSSGQAIFEPEKRGPVQATLRLAPVPQFHLDAQLSYDTKFSRATSYSVAAGANWGAQYANVSWTATRPTVLTPPGPSPPPGYQAISPDSDFIRAAAGLDLFSKHWRLDTQLNYNVRQHQLVEDRTLLTYNGSCYTILLEVRNYRLAPVRHDYRLVVNLKNIGTLLDVNGGLDKIF
jgi:LPS-assembly protein